MKSQERIHLEASLIILAGLPLSGKTTLGQTLANHTDAKFFDIDQARQEIASGNDWLGPEKEKEIMLAAYIRNHQKAEEALRLGTAVVLAATYSRENYHRMALDVADAVGVSLNFFLVEIPESELEKRIELRKQSGSDSNITDLQSYYEIRDRYIPPPKAGSIDGTLLVEISAKRIISKLAEH